MRKSSTNYSLTCGQRSHVGTRDRPPARRGHASGRRRRRSNRRPTPKQSHLVMIVNWYSTHEVVRLCAELERPAPVPNRRPDPGRLVEAVATTTMWGGRGATSLPRTGLTGPSGPDQLLNREQALPDDCLRLTLADRCRTSQTRKTCRRRRRRGALHVAQQLVMGEPVSSSTTRSSVSADTADSRNRTERPSVPRDR